MKNKNIKVILFDMDGVLIDAKEWHYNALNKALLLFGYIITRDEHEGFYDGLPTKVKLKKLGDEKGLSSSLYDFINEMKQQYTIDEIYNNSYIDFSKQIMLKKIKEKGIKLGVCSNSIKNSIELMLKKAMIYDYFDIIISADDVKKSKPSPEMYNLAIKKLNIKPENTIIIEDSPHGIEAAEKSGSHVIKVKNSNEVHYGLFKNIL